MASQNKALQINSLESIISHLADDKIANQKTYGTAEVRDALIEVFISENKEAQLLSYKLMYDLCYGNHGNKELFGTAEVRDALIKGLDSKHKEVQMWLYNALIKDLSSNDEESHFFSYELKYDLSINYNTPRIFNRI